MATLGKSRWTADGRRLTFTGHDEQGFDPDWVTEILGLSPDGSKLVIFEAKRLFSLMVAEGIPGMLVKNKSKK